MEIFKAGVRPTKKASSEWFTGTVWQDPIVTAPEPARVRALLENQKPNVSSKNTAFSFIVTNSEPNFEAVL